MALHAVKANGADVFVMSNNRVFHDTTSEYFPKIIIFSQFWIFVQRVAAYLHCPNPTQILTPIPNVNPIGPDCEKCRHNTPNLITIPCHKVCVEGYKGTHQSSNHLSLPKMAKYLNFVCFPTGGKLDNYLCWSTVPRVPG